MKRGPRAVIECPEEIPCDPCEEACPRGAISVGRPITNRPVLEEGKCTGCGACVAACPGLAIFVVDPDYSKTEATVAFPYEYLPRPSPGDDVAAVDRTGSQVCKAKVLSVARPPRYDRTAVVTVAVPKGAESQVRGIARTRGGAAVGR